MNKNSLLSMQDLSAEQILSILGDAKSFNSSHKDWQLPKHNALVANLFFEASTRTHFSFESAEYQLGCKVADFNASTSSVTKGESLYDTVKTFEAIGYDAVVIRHPKDEYFKELENINIPILNAGDGAGNHPTQCLLDLLTMYDEFKDFKGLNVVIAGDIQHSRVAASNKQALEKLGANVFFAGPEEWQREGYPTMDFDEACKWADVVMMLRIQRERGASLANMSDEEAESLVKEFSTLEAEMSLLDAVDTEGVEEMVYPFEAPTIFLREDEVSNVISQDDAMANVKKKLEGHFVLPKVVK